MDRKRKIEGIIFLVLFCLTIPAANWMIGHVGTVCVPNSACLIPVAPGLMAPSGVVMIGAALVLHDLVQRRLGIADLPLVGARANHLPLAELELDAAQAPAGVRPRVREAHDAVDLRFHRAGRDTRSGVERPLEPRGCTRR